MSLSGEHKDAVRSWLPKLRQTFEKHFDEAHLKRLGLKSNGSHTPLDRMSLTEDDVVSFVLETHYGIWSAQVLIKPKGYSKKKRTFGEVQFQKIDSTEGRLSGLLPRAKNSQPLPLH